MNNPTVRNLYAHITQDELDELRAKVSEHDRVVRERDRLLAQVATLQSDANSWQSGYDKGRADGGRHGKHERDQLRAEVERLREALKHARQFIVNGIDLGVIRMPDADTPDAAHDMLPMIDAALSGGEEGQ